jgi:hypothetical protein
MLYLAALFASVSVLLGIGFFRKYQARVRLETLNAMRYHRIADYYGSAIPLAFEYRDGRGTRTVEADVDEIYHYGRDYFLKGRSPDGKRSLVFKWNRVAHPRVRFDGRSLESLEDLFRTVAGGARAAA